MCKRVLATKSIGTNIIGTNIIGTNIIGTNIIGTNIILHGGLFRIFNPVVESPIIYLPVNISLKKSTIWLNGTVYIKENPYYRITARRDNRIEIKKIEDFHLLLVNENIIYDTKDEFNYTVNVKLNPYITTKPYADFFKYYQ